MSELDRFKEQLNAYAIDNPPQFGYQRTVPLSSRVNSTKEQDLLSASTSKKSNLNAAALEKQQNMAFETMPLSRTGINIWDQPNVYNNTPRAPQGELIEMLKSKFQETQPGIEDPLVQVQRFADTTPDTGSLYPFNAWKTPGGEDITELIPQGKRGASFEEDTHIRQEQLNAVKARLRGEEYVPQEYVSYEDPYDKFAHLEQPGDRQYATSRTEYWKYISPGNNETLYSGENTPRFSNTGDNLQLEHGYPMSWVREDINKQFGTNLDRAEFNKHSARFNEIEADMHNLSPARGGLNKVRGSMMYGDIEGDFAFDDGGNIELDARNQVVEPREGTQGALARQTLYMADKYDLPLPAEQKTLMEKWNKEYPANEEERLKNHMIERMQGNRNKFIPAMDEKELKAALQNPDNQYRQKAAEVFTDNRFDEEYQLQQKAKFDSPGDIAKDMGIALLGKGVLGVSQSAYGLGLMAAEPVRMVASLASQSIGGPRVPGIEETLELGKRFEQGREYLTSLQSASTQLSIREAQRNKQQLQKERDERIAEKKEAGTYDNIDAAVDWLGTAKDSVAALIDEPLALTDAVTGSLLFAAPVRAAGSVANKLLIKEITKKGISKDDIPAFLNTEAGKKLSKEAAQVAGTTSVAALEAGVNYVDTRNEVMGMTEAELTKGSKPYNAWREQGLTHKQAKNNVADRTAFVAAGTTALIAGGAARVSGAGEFEATLGKKTFKPGVGRAATIGIAGGREGLEEAIQGGGGTFATNLGIKDTADSERSLAEGTAAGTGEGLITGVGAGVGLSTLASVPAMAAGTFQAAGKGGKQLSKKASVAKDRIKYGTDTFENYGKIGSPGHNPVRAINDLARNFSGADVTQEQKSSLLREMQSHYQVLTDNFIEASKNEGSPKEIKAAQAELTKAGRTIKNLSLERRRNQVPINATSLAKVTAGEELNPVDVRNILDELSHFISDFENADTTALTALNNAENLPLEVQEMLDAANTLKEQTNTFEYASGTKNKNQGAKLLDGVLRGLRSFGLENGMTTGQVAQASPLYIMTNLQGGNPEGAAEGINILESYLGSLNEYIANTESSGKAVPSDLKQGALLLEQQLRAVKALHVGDTGLGIKKDANTMTPAERVAEIEEINDPEDPRVQELKARTAAEYVGAFQGNIPEDQIRTREWYEEFQSFMDRYSDMREAGASEVELSDMAKVMSGMFVDLYDLAELGNKYRVAEKTTKESTEESTEETTEETTEEEQTEQTEQTEKAEKAEEDVVDDRNPPPLSDEDIDGAHAKKQPTTAKTEVDGDASLANGGPNTTDEAIDYIKNNTKNTLFLTILNTIERFIPKGMPIYEIHAMPDEFEDVPHVQEVMRGEAAGVTLSKGTKKGKATRPIAILYDKNSDTFQNTPIAGMLHELIHAATIGVINDIIAGVPGVTKKQIAAFEKLQTLMKSVVSELDISKDAVKNEAELLAYGLTDESTVEAMNNLWVNDDGTVVTEKQPGFVNALKYYAAALMEMLGLRQGPTTAFEALLRRSAELSSEREVTALDSDIADAAFIKAQNVFKVVPSNNVPQAEKQKAPIKAKVSTKYIGFGGGSTGLYREQIEKQGGPVNETTYSPDDVVFVSVNGKPTIEDFNNTVELVKAALDAGATVLTDSVEYLRKSTYNKGEKALRKVLKEAGYIDTTSNKQKNIAIWRTPNAADKRKVLKEQKKTIKGNVEGVSTKSTIEDFHTRRKAQSFERTDTEQETNKGDKSKEFDLANYLWELSHELTNLKDKLDPELYASLRTRIEDIRKLEKAADKNSLGSQSRKTVVLESKNQLKELRNIVNKELAPYRTYNIKDNTQVIIPHKKEPFYRYISYLANIAYRDPVIRAKRNKLINRTLNKYHGGLTTEELHALGQDFLVDLHDFLLKTFLPNSQADILNNSYEGKSEKTKVPFRVTDDYVVRGRDSSAISLFPFFVDMSLHPDLKASMQELFGITEDQVNSMEDILNNIIEFENTAVGKTIKESFELTAEDVRNDPMSSLRDGNGDMPSKVLQAMAVTALDWVGSQGSATLDRPDYAINAIVGQPSDTPVPEDLRNMLRTRGALSTTTAITLGKRALSQINIQAAAGTDGIAQVRLQAALGKQMLAALQKMGLVRWSSLANSDLAQYRILDYQGNIKDKTVNNNSTLFFVRLTGTPDKYGNIVPSEKVEELQLILETGAKTFQSLFGLQGALPALSKEPIEQAPTNIRNSRTKTSPLHKKGAVAGQAVPFQIHLPLLQVMDLFTLEEQLTPYGFVEDLNTVHITKRDGQKDKNASLVRDYREMVNYRDTYEDGDRYYYEYEFHSNTRMHVTRRGLSYQSSKFHRNNVHPSTWVISINLADRTDQDTAELNKYKIALAETFGQEANNTSNEDQISFINKIINNQGTIAADVFSGKLRKAVNAIKKAKRAIASGDTASLTKEERTNILEVVDLMGEAGLSMNGLYALADLSAALSSKDSAWQSVAPREVDATTDGVVNAAISLAPTAESAKSIARSGGYVFKGDEQAQPGYTYANWINTPGNFDNYQNVARGLYNAFRSKLHFYSNVTDPAKQKRAQAKYDQLVALENMIGQLIDNEGLADEVISKVARNLAKYPLMTKVYSSLDKSVVALFAKTSLEVFYDNLMATENREKFSEEQQLGELIRLIETVDTALYKNSGGRLTGNYSYKSYVETEILAKGVANYVLPAQDGTSGQDLFKALSSETFGEPLISGIYEVLGNDFKAKNDWVNGAARAINEIFKALYQDKAREVAKEYPDMKVLSDALYEEILQELMDENLWAGAAHSSTKSNNDLFDLLAVDLKDIPEKQGGKPSTFFKSGIEVIASTFDTVLDYDEQGRENSINQETQTKKTISSSSSRLKVSRPSGQPGLIALPGLAIAMDANNMAESMAKLEAVMNVFDALVSSTSQAAENAQFHNRVSMEQHMDYDILTALYEALNRMTRPEVLQGMSQKARTTIQNSLSIKSGGQGLAMPITLQAAKLAGVKVYDKGDYLITYATSISAFKKGLKKEVERTQTERTGIINEFYGSDHSPAGEGSFALMDPAVATKDPLADVNKQKEFKKDTAAAIEESTKGWKDITLEDVPDDHNTHGSQLDPLRDFQANGPAIIVDASSVEHIFDELANKGNVEETVQHSDYLRELLRNMIKPGLRLLGNHNLYQGNVVEINGSYDPQNKGANNGQDLYVAAAQGEVLWMGQMSAQEVYVHELVHAMWSSAIGGGVPSLRRKLMRLYNIAEKEFTPEDFLKRDAQGNVLFAPGNTYEDELAKAKEQYDYIFGSGKDYLHEFATYGLTNPTFVKKLGSLPNKIDRKVPDGTLLQKLQAFFMEIVDWIAGTVKGVDHKTVGGSLQILARDMRNINNVNEAKIDKAFSAFHDLNVPFKKIITKYGLDPYARSVQRIQARGPASNTPRRTFNNIYSAAYNFYQPDFRRYIEDQAYNWGLTKDNPVAKLINEIRGATEITQEFYTQLRQNKYLLDQRRQQIISSAAADMVAHMDPEQEYTEDDYIKLTASMLKTDVSSILDDFTVQDIATILFSRSKQEQQIERIHKQLSNLFTNKDTVHYLNLQAESQGHNMAIGTTLIRYQFFNATAVADVLERTDVTEGADMGEVTNLVNTLMTLYAIKYTDHASNQRTAEIMRHEDTRVIADNELDGIDYMLKMHLDVNKQALRENFHNDPFLMIKGYTHEKYDPFVDMHIDSSANKKSLEKEGFIMTKKVKVEANSPLERDLHIFINPIGGMQRRMTGSVSLTNMQHKGSTLMEIFHDRAIGEEPAKAAEAEKQRLIRLNNASLKRQLAGKEQLNFDQNFMVPIYSPNSRRIIDFRYTMTEANKVELLGKKDLAYESLASMAGSILDKVQTNINNKNVFELVKADSALYYAQNPRDYVAIGPEVEDDKYREIYTLLPKDSKRDFEEMFPDGEMLIREDLIDLVFGYRKASLTDFLDKKTKEWLGGEQRGLPKIVRKSMKLSGMVWEYFVSRMKTNVVIFTPSVIVNNVVSNEMILVWKGVPPTLSLKDSGEALRELTHYQNDVKKRMLLERRLKLDPGRADAEKVKRQILQITSNIETNPVHRLVEEGLFQSITEDLEAGQEGLEAALLNILPGGKLFAEKQLDKVPNTAKTIWKNTMLTPDTVTYNVLTRATQYSDFVARYVLFKHQTTRQGMSVEESLNDVVDTFINYDIPTSPELQWLNDMGFLMFTKFALRILRVVHKMLGAAPASALTSGLVQQMLGVNLPGIIDSNAITNGLSMPLLRPTSFLDTVTMIRGPSYINDSLDIF